VRRRSRLGMQRSSLVARFEELQLKPFTTYEHTSHVLCVSGPRKVVRYTRSVTRVQSPDVVQQSADYPAAAEPLERSRRFACERTFSDCKLGPAKSARVRAWKKLPSWCLCLRSLKYPSRVPRRDS
jgi:hypothetical protein